MSCSVRSQKFPPLMLSKVLGRSWTPWRQELREMTGVSPPDGEDIWGNPPKLVTRWRDAPMSASGHRGNYWQCICMSHTQHSHTRTRARAHTHTHIHTNTRTHTQNTRPHVATDSHSEVEQGQLLAQGINKTFISHTPAAPHSLHLR